MNTTRDVPRDPGEYALTIHASQRRRQRDIPLELIADTIRDGEVRNTHHADSRMFVDDHEGYDGLLGVVAEIESGDIKTVCWRDS